MCSSTKTGIVFDDRMAEHACIWDPEHVEKPSRYSFSLQKCKEYGLIDRCKIIPSRPATEEELLLVHSKKYIDEIKYSKTLDDESDFEAFASKYDSVYFNNKTYDCALLAAGSTLQLVSSVLNGSIKNGMAIVRPPGHHAMPSEACGFCFFNNVAIAAKYAMENFSISRIMIVDWDVHHGQATQHVFYDDSRVLYFSIHRYQNGAFWPHLRESNFDYVGEISAKGYNINVPLNGNGQGNAEYLAMFNNILLPIAYEFSPELILISAGYDAALGCCEGEMKVTPQAYPHFINSLSCLANGRICAILEGGYCISSLSESVALTIRGLLGDPCPLIGPCFGINQITVDSILNVLSVQRLYWDSVKLQELYKSDSEFNGDKHFVHIEYTGHPFGGIQEFPTRDYNPVMLPHVSCILEGEIKDLISKTDLSVPNYKTCFIVSSRNKDHSSSCISEHSMKFLKSLYDNGVLCNCTMLELNETTKNDFIEFLNAKEINKLKSTWRLSDEVRMQLEQNVSQSVCQDTNFDFLQLVNAVATRNCLNGYNLNYSAKNLIDSNNSKYNEMALAVSYLIEQHFMKRILIITFDWSVNHNNMQEVFYKDDKILNISLHHCGKKDCTMLIQDVGCDKGKGYNVNIPFIHTVSDGDYLAALFHIILPIAYEFCPEFLLISTVFNNECPSLLSPSCYGSMVKILSALCNGKMVLNIEGWDHVNSFNNASDCISALLGNAEISVSPGFLRPCPEAIQTIQNVAKIQRKYWGCLQFNKALPSKIQTINISHENKDAKPRHSSNPVAIPRRQDEPGPSTMDDWMGAAAGFDNNVELFCVTPLEYCPHLDLLQPIPVEGLNPFARCSSCNDPNENWVCLHCYQVYCGRFINQHMVQHGQDMQHFLTLSYSDLSVWCYACDSYIHNQLLVPIKEHAHYKKFGEI